MQETSAAESAPAWRSGSSSGGRTSVPGMPANEVAWVVVARRAITLAGALSIVILVIWSAILAKTAGEVLPLAAIRVEPIGIPAAESTPSEAAAILPRLTSPDLTDLEQTAQLPMQPRSGSRTSKASSQHAAWAKDPTVRWFNGRPAKPDRTIWMRVTAYSPDSRSCGTSDDGLTATMHSVETNGFRLVAADPKVLPYGSMVSIEGYDKGHIVPVLDCGGAIKGNHIDLLFPTHEQARQWGSKLMNVVVWKYIDGKPAENPRKVR